MTLEKQIQCLALSQQIKQKSVILHVLFCFLITLGQLCCDSTALGDLEKQILSYTPAA